MGLLQLRTAITEEWAFGPQWPVTPSHGNALVGSAGKAVKPPTTKTFGVRLPGRIELSEC